MKKCLFFVLFTLTMLTAHGLNYNVTVPAGTKACYIAGEMNGWTQQAMTKLDATHYFLDIANATITQKYKYCSGPGWAYVENTPNGENRSYLVNDVVSSWALIFDPSTTPTDWVYSVTVPEGTNACYFVGKATDWVHKQMSRLDNTHFTITINTTFPETYKYCSGPDWAYEELDNNGQTILDRSYKTSDIVLKWKQIYYASPIGVAYNVTVPSGTKSCFLSGDMNNWGFTAMTKTDDTHFMLNVPNANTGQKYVYCSGPDLSYKETNAAGNAIANRAYKPSDVVAKWPSIYTPTSSITLTSNFTQKSYECGTTLSVTWNSINVQNVKILFSGNYGLTWSEIASSIPAINGKYEWTLPTQALYQCRIMICDIANSQVCSVSNGMFVIYNHLPEKVEPLLKTYYQVFLYPYNSKYPNTDTSDSQYINGKAGNACGPTAVSNILTYWEYPRKGFGSRTFTDAKNCLWSADFSATDYNYDLSNDNLSANSPSSIIDANATLMYHAAVGMYDPYRSGNSIGVLNAFKQYFGYNANATELNRDDYLPEQWEKIMKSELSLGRPQIVQGWGNIFGSGGYGGHWFMCDGYSADNLFHISLDYGADGKKYCPLYEFDVYKMKNWIFAYLVPEKNGKDIKLNFPIGGENWQQESIKNIQWNSTGVSNLKIEFSADDGYTWTTLINSVSAANGNCNVTIPANTVSAKCKIRLTDTDNINVYSRNKHVFSVYDTKSISLTTPQETTQLVVSTKFPIRWTTKGITTLKIEYSTNNGANWNLLTEVTASENVYKWTVPNEISTQCKLRIVDKSDLTSYTESPVFSIVATPPIGGPYPSDNNTVTLYHFDNDFVNDANPSVLANPFNTVNFSQNVSGLDYALKIDNTVSGVSSCIVLPHENSLSLVNDWTIEFWFNINSWGGTTTAYPYIFLKSGANYFVFLDVSTKSLHVGYDYEGGAENLFLPNNVLTLNKWYHILYTRNTQNLSLNCQLRDQNRNLLQSKSINYNPNHVPKTNTSPINIGGFSGGSNVQFDGYIDEVRISNRVRTFIITNIDKPTQLKPVEIYPNPASSKVFVRTLNRNGSITQISIINANGQQVFAKEYPVSDKPEIDLTGFNKGIYLVKIIVDAMTHTERLIVQ